MQMMDKITMRDVLAYVHRSRGNQGLVRQFSIPAPSHGSGRYQISVAPAGSIRRKRASVCKMLDTGRHSTEHLGENVHANRLSL